MFGQSFSPACKAGSLLVLAIISGAALSMPALGFVPQQSQTLRPFAASPSPSCPAAGNGAKGAVGLSMAGKGFGKASETGGDKSGGQAGAPADAVMYLPLESIKVGALRMFLGFWVMAQADWKGSQGEDGTLMAVSADGQGGALIEFKDEEEVGGAAIVVWRVEGNTLPYRLKEALLMHSFLDELESILDDPEADKNKAIFKLREPDGISQARAGLAARPQ